MIGVDTNILLRLWLDDDAGQNRRIDALLEAYGTQPASVLISDVVLVEAIWTLRSGYRRDKPAQLTALRSLMAEPAFAFEDREAMGLAVAWFEQASCGFSDCLVAAKHARLSCEFTATFDRRMRSLPNVRIL